MKALLIIPCICLLGVSGYAQIPPGKVRWIPTGPDTERAVDSVRNKVQDEVGGIAEIEEIEPLGEEDPRLLPVTLEVMGYPSTVPSRLGSGGFGKLMLTLVIKPHVVITPDTPLQLFYEPQQGPISIGRYALRPAKQTLDDGALFGEMIWDGSAIFELPLEVAPDTPPGEYRVALRAEFELKNARSGFTMGRFRNSFPAKIRVVEAAEGAIAVTAAAGDGVTEAAAATEPGERVGQMQPVGVLREAPAEPVEEPADPGLPGLPDGSVQVPMLLWVLGAIGALALLGTIVLVVSRVFRP